MTVFMALNQLAAQLRSHIATSDKRHDERDKMVNGLALNVSLVAAGCLAMHCEEEAPTTKARAEVCLLHCSFGATAFAWWYSLV
jgi:hypothetical protein